jgi:hypothetical protein
VLEETRLTAKQSLRTIQAKIDAMSTWTVCGVLFCFLLKIQ